LRRQRKTEGNEDAGCKERRKQRRGEDIVKQIKDRIKKVKNKDEQKD